MNKPWMYKIGICLCIVFLFSSALYINTSVFSPHVRTLVSRSKTSEPSVQTPTPTPVHWPRPIPILMYHYIEYVQDKGDTIRQSLDILPHVFEKQLETLLNAGYTPMTMAELGEVFDGKRTIPIKPIILTFDDGYRDFYTDAYPIMKKYHVKGTQYVISGYIGYKNYMTSAEIVEIANDGLVEIGAHTVHHVSLKFAPLEEMQTEVKLSKEQLENLTQKPIVSFAYPNGSYDDRAIATIREFGFTTGVGTKPGIEIDPKERFSLVRIRPGSNTGADLLKRIHQKSY